MFLCSCWALWKCFAALSETGQFLFFSFYHQAVCSCSSGEFAHFHIGSEYKKQDRKKGRGMRCIQNEDKRSASDRLRMDDSDSRTGTDGLWRGTGRRRRSGTGISGDTVTRNIGEQHTVSAALIRIMQTIWIYHRKWRAVFV